MMKNDAREKKEIFTFQHVRLSLPKDQFLHRDVLAWHGKYSLDRKEFLAMFLYLYNHRQSQSNVSMQKFIYKIFRSVVAANNCVE